MNRLYTYGYDSYPIGKVIDHLTSNGVRHVVDVRFKPFSRNPSYRQGPLRSQLTLAGIRYTHMPGLGNRNYKGGPVDLMDASKIVVLLEMIEKEEGVCILCVCPKPEGCHRRLISDTLQGIMELEVVDL